MMIVFVVIAMMRAGPVRPRLRRRRIDGWRTRTG